MSDSAMRHNLFRKSGVALDTNDAEWGSRRWVERKRTEYLLLYYTTQFPPGRCFIFEDRNVEHRCLTLLTVTFMSSLFFLLKNL